MGGVYVRVRRATEAIWFLEIHRRLFHDSAYLGSLVDLDLHSRDEKVQATDDRMLT